MIKISQAEARKIILHCQRLFPSNRRGKAIDATLCAIRHLGYVQIDTILVVERAHHHTLWNRNPRYHPSHIDRLQQQRRIFEYWAHAAAYLPMEEYRYCLRRMRAIAGGQRHWFDRDRAMMGKVMKRIREEGPLQSRDFESKHTKKREMWDWKPAKRALEQLFMEGELMITRRDNFQKVYDLAENVLPMDTVVSEPDDGEWMRHLVIRFLRANGIGNATEIGYLRRGVRADIEHTVNEMCEQGKVVKVGVDGEVYYALADSLTWLDKSIARRSLRILSPFDNLVIQRKRIKKLFDFDYQIECYLPPDKRIYGYFCLPLLWDAGLIGRADCKADRKNSTLRVRNLVIEKTVRFKEQLVEKLTQELVRFARFNQCTDVDIESMTDTGLKNALCLALESRESRRQAS